MVTDEGVPVSEHDVERDRPDRLLPSRLDSGGGLHVLLVGEQRLRLLLVRLGGREPAVALVEEAAEDEQQPEDLELVYGVVVSCVGDQDGHHLPQVHGGREDQGPELLHLGVDEPLAAHGRGAQREGVAHDRRVRAAETEGLAGLLRGHQRDERDDAGEAIDVEHLVVLRGAVLLEQLLLEGRGEAVEAQEEQEQEQAMRTRARRVLGLDASGHEELGHAASDGRGDSPIPPAVALLRDDDAPDHHGHHLETLAQHLHGEGHVLEGLVLARAGIDVGQRDGEILPQGGFGRQALALGHRHGDREDDGAHAVHEDQEDGVGEQLPAIAQGDHPLLQQPVHQEGEDDAGGVERAPHGLHERGRRGLRGMGQRGLGGRGGHRRREVEPDTDGVSLTGSSAAA
mmetsp:Transcript_96587/g.255082  ORF Transcript_96587/g.255082 Transcript_96587/m.255082 type:complete len:399 (-) Transcript_96587:18-1214(-)